MNVFRRFAITFSQTTRTNACLFSNDKWKERDEAAEKVYISQQQKETLKKLLKKVELQEQDQQSNLEQFDRKLNGVMKRYRIDNDALKTEIVKLHENYRQ